VSAIIAQRGDRRRRRGCVGAIAAILALGAVSLPGRPRAGMSDHAYGLGVGLPDNTESGKAGALHPTPASPLSSPSTRNRQSLCGCSRLRAYCAPGSGAGIAHGAFWKVSGSWIPAI
jgi:hypothetical protein